MNDLRSVLSSYFLIFYRCPCYILFNIFNIFRLYRLLYVIWKCLFLCLHVRLICALNYYLLTYLLTYLLDLRISLGVNNCCYAAGVYTAAFVSVRWHGQRTVGPSVHARPSALVVFVFELDVVLPRVPTYLLSRLRHSRCDVFSALIQLVSSHLILPHLVWTEYAVKRRSSPWLRPIGRESRTQLFICQHFPRMPNKFDCATGNRQDHGRI